MEGVELKDCGKRKKMFNEKLAKILMGIGVVKGQLFIFVTKTYYRY